MNWKSISPKTSILIQSLIFQTAATSPLGVLDHLHVGASSEGSKLEPRTVPGHGWEERGSSKFILLTDLNMRSN